MSEVSWVWVKFISEMSWVWAKLRYELSWGLRPQVDVWRKLKSETSWRMRQAEEWGKLTSHWSWLSLTKRKAKRKLWLWGFGRSSVDVSDCWGLANRQADRQARGVTARMCWLERWVAELADGPRLRRQAGRCHGPGQRAKRKLGDDRRIFFVVIPFFVFKCFVCSLKKEAYPENSRVVFCHNKQRSFEPFMCLDLGDNRRIVTSSALIFVFFFFVDLAVLYNYPNCFVVVVL